MSMTTRLLALTAAGLLLAACERQPPETEATATAEETSSEREALAAQSNLPQPTTETALLDCADMAGMTVYCGFKNPEDLVRIPDTNLLLVSEMGEFMLDTPGTLSALDLDQDERMELTLSWTAPTDNWGSDDCTVPDIRAFSPHGIDLTTRDDGKIALLVVNHGKRESVEFFEVDVSDGSPALAWRGCAVPPGDAFINDVAARHDGGFYVTHMWNKTAAFEETAATLLAGKPTGWVWSWNAGDGFTRLTNTDDMMPNGIAINADNTHLFVNVYMGNKTFKLDLETGERAGTLAARQPDNITVAADGMLWIASHQHDPIGQTCAQVTAGPCLLPFQVIKADPESMRPVAAFNHDGPPMGYSTVALVVDGSVYLGSAHGDRVVALPLP